MREKISAIRTDKNYNHNFDNDPNHDPMGVVGSKCGENWHIIGVKLSWVNLFIEMVESGLSMCRMSGKVCFFSGKFSLAKWKNVNLNEC